jgi:hypothetical protein
VSDSARARAETAARQLRAGTSAAFEDHPPLHERTGGSLGLTPPDDDPEDT